MKPLGHLFALEALDLSRRGADRTTSLDGEELSLRPSREDIAAAWRRWAEAGPADRPVRLRRALTLPAPDSGV